MNTESFVFYESVYKQAERLEKKLGKEVGYDFLKAVIEFGLYGAVPDEDDNAWLYGLEQTITSIGAAKDRYAAAVENGKKGGRPVVELKEKEVLKKKEELGTWKAVASYYGVTEQTLRNKRVEWEKQKNPKNLNDNVNVNVNDNVKDNEKEKEKEKVSAICAEGTTSNCVGTISELKAQPEIVSAAQSEKVYNIKETNNNNKKEIDNEKDFSYLYDEVGCDGYILKKKKWIDRMCWNFPTMSAQERIEYIETLDFSHEEAEYIVNNILEI